MNVLEKFQTIQQQGQTTTEEALQLFDELDTVDLDFMKALYYHRKRRNLFFFCGSTGYSFMS